MKTTRMNKTWIAVVVLASSLVTGLAQAAEPAACAESPAKQGRAVERFDGTGLMMMATQLEKRGEANFHLQYDEPASPCIADKFAVGDASVAVLYSPWQKGASTLLYRLTVTRPSGGSSDILVLYDGMASLLAGGGLMFHVSEERQGVISWYAMFREEPSLADVRTLAEKIVEGDAKPLLAVTWPKGAKEGEIVAVDSSRLK